MKLKKLIIPTIALTMAMTSISYAGTWKQDQTGWWWQEDNGSYPVNAWKEVNGKWYYFGADGYMLANTTTPDGYQVGADGAWITAENTSQFRINSKVLHCMNAHSLDELLAGLPNASVGWGGGRYGNDYVEKYDDVNADGLPTSVEWITRQAAKENPLGKQYASVADESAPVSYGLKIWTYHMTEVFDGLTKSSYTVNEFETMLKTLGATNIKSNSKKMNGSIAGIAIDEYYVETEFILGNYECSVVSYPKNRVEYVPYDTHVYINTIFNE